MDHHHHQTCDELKAQHERMVGKHPAPYRVYLPDEVSVHDSADDAWVILNGRVLDITAFLAQPDVLMNPPLEELLAYAGTDISRHFLADGTPRTGISALGSRLPTLAATAEATMYTNSGKQPRPSNNADDAAARSRVYWWQAGAPWQIGRITSDRRRLRIVNTMTISSQTMAVCEEDTLNEIRAKYNARYNAHSGSYTWRKSPRSSPNVSGSLDMARTLTENGIVKEAHTSVPPSIWLFYNDDFTVA